MRWEKFPKFEMMLSEKGRRLSWNYWGKTQKSCLHCFMTERITVTKIKIMTNIEVSLIFWQNIISTKISCAKGGSWGPPFLQKRFWNLDHIAYKISIMNAFVFIIFAIFPQEISETCKGIIFLKLKKSLLHIHYNVIVNQAVLGQHLV